MDNAADRKSIRAKEKLAKQLERETAEVLRSFLAGRAGRRWMWDLLASCGIFTALYPSMPDLGALLGERNVGLRLLAQIMQHCPDLFLLMQREANERHDLEHNTSGSEHDGSPDSGGDVDGPDFGSHSDND